MLAGMSCQSLILCWAPCKAALSGGSGMTLQLCALLSTCNPKLLFHGYSSRQPLRADTKAHLDVSICTPTFRSHLPPSHLRIHILHLASCRVHLSHPGTSQSFHAFFPFSRHFPGSIRAHAHLFAHLILRAAICRVHLDLDLPSPSKLSISSAKIHVEDTDRKVGFHIFFRWCQPSSSQLEQN